MSKSDLIMSKSLSFDPTAEFNKIKELVKQRGSLKIRLTMLCTNVNALEKQILDHSKQIELKLRIQSIATLMSEFNEVQTKLDRLLPESDIDVQLEEREFFENKCYSTIAQAERMLGIDSVPSTTSVYNENLGITHQAAKLPTITVPTFDGSYEDWPEFKNTYLTVIHMSNTISNIQKFHYLKSLLEGPAKLVINSLKFTPDNYHVAWELLLNKYDDCSLLVHNHVKALFSLKRISTESPSSLLKLINDVMKNLQSLKNLGEPTEHWDTLIIYMIVSKLDESTRKAWEEYRREIALGKQQNDSSGKVVVRVHDLLQFLKTRADMLETLHLSRKQNKK